MPLTKYTNLDFVQIKTSIKSYLRANSNFTDFDFEGSNFSILIDTLAYNTYITAFNTNMVVNESFIDSATLRENVVSLARNIGYIPRSRKAAKANISFFVEVNDSSIKSLTLKSGVTCNSTSFGQSRYVFSLLNDVTVPVVNQIASFDTIDVYEGSYAISNYTVNNSTPNQRFIIDN